MLAKSGLAILVYWFATIICFAETIPVADSETLKLADQIDQILGGHFKEANQNKTGQPYELGLRISDSDYLRRSYLIVLGRNPTLHEVNRFPALESDKHKLDRLRLVRELTQSREFAHQEFRQWIAQLGLSPDGNSAAQVWLLKQIELGTPLDKWTADWFGNYAVSILAPGAPQAPEVDLAKTGVWVDAFVGKGLSCAQCHDHPFEEVSHKQFLQLAGFMNDQGAIKVPDSYYYTSAEPGAPIPAATFFGTTKLEAYRDTNRFREKFKHQPWPGIDSAQQFGDWLVTADSLVFDLQIITRGWKRVFGVDLIDYHLGVTKGESKGQALIDSLVSILHKVEYDYGKFLQVLMASRIAHLEMVPQENHWAIWNQWFLLGPISRELTFDQRERSLSVLESGNTEPNLDFPMNKEVYRPEAAWLTSADIERRVLRNPSAPIWNEINLANSDTEALAIIFKATLARPPGEKESDGLLELAGNPNELRNVRMGRVLWAVLMGEKFVNLP